MLVAGVDSSTQSTKVVLCDTDDGTVVGRGSAPHPPGTEADPADWWAALRQAGHGLLDRAAAVGVAGQQHGMVVLGEEGEVVRPALLWNDLRSAPAAAVLLPHDWLTWRLLGGMAEPAGPGHLAAMVTDRGDASGTGYFSPATGVWLPDLVKAAVGRTLRLPRVAGPGEVVGQTAWGAVVSAGTGDNMGAALGLGLAPGDVAVSIGTSGTAFAVSEIPADDPSGAVAGFADATGRFLPLVCTINAGLVLSATVSLLGTDLDGLSELALAAKPGAGGITLLPYLDGERTPARARFSRVAFRVVSPRSTPVAPGRSGVRSPSR